MVIANIMRRFNFKAIFYSIALLAFLGGCVNKHTDMSEKSLSGLTKNETGHLFYKVRNEINSKNNNHTRNSLMDLLGPPKDIVCGCKEDGYPDSLYYIMKWSNKGLFLEVYFDHLEHPYSSFSADGY